MRLKLFARDENLHDRFPNEVDPDDFFFLSEPDD